MKKKILSQLMILSFAFAGLFLVGSNVLGLTGEIGGLPIGKESCTSSTKCNIGFGDGTGSNGVKYCCQYASVRGYADKTGIR